MVILELYQNLRLKTITYFVLRTKINNKLMNNVQ